MTNTAAVVERPGLLPTRLRKEPLLEAVWELRFEPSQPSGGDLLAGVIFSALRADLELSKVEPLPISAMPSELRDGDPNLRYQATTRLTGGRFVVSVGRRVVALSSVKPYVGWATFHERIMKLLDVALAADIIKRAERFSLKYVDVLSAEICDSTLNSLRVSIECGSNRLDRQPTVLRAEIRGDDVIHVVTIASPVEYRAGEQIQGGGIAIDVDSIADLRMGNDPGQEIRQRIENVHQTNKRVFFDLLTQETLDKLEPEY